MPVAKKHYLKLVLRDDIVESAGEFSFFSRRDRTSLRELVEAIDRASRVRTIEALALILREQLYLGWGAAEELRAAIARFRASGKKTICYAESLANGEYFLASACDRIALAPAGTLNLVGLRAEVLFMKQLLDRLGVQAELMHRGKYKAAGDMFTRTSMSEQHREELEALLAGICEQLVTAVANSRNRTVEQVRQLIDAGPYTSAQAQESGLIDQACWEDQIEDILKDWCGHKLSALERHALRTGLIRRVLTARRPRIGLIVAEGVIASGRSKRRGPRGSTVGSQTLVELLRQARRDKRVRAIVLRIDSPGGSALASDLIWREVKLADEKKPLVASFGNLAASGGYYIATAARHIVSHAATLTGSIGVIGGKFVLEDLLGKASVHIERVSIGRHASYTSPLSRFSDEEREHAQIQIDEFYFRQFIPKVAASRRLSTEEVLAVAEGRVWTGADAFRVRLVDQVGSVHDALLHARRAAGLKDAAKVTVVEFIARRRLRDLFSPAQLSESLSDSITTLAPLRCLDGLSALAGSIERVWLLLPWLWRIR